MRAVADMRTSKMSTSAEQCRRPESQDARAGGRAAEYFHVGSEEELGEVIRAQVIRVLMPSGWLGCESASTATSIVTAHTR